MISTLARCEALSAMDRVFCVILRSNVVACTSSKTVRESSGITMPSSRHSWRKFLFSSSSNPAANLNEILLLMGTSPESVMLALYAGLWIVLHVQAPIEHSAHVAELAAVVQQMGQVLI